VCLAAAAGADGQDIDKSQRTAMKHILTTTIKQLEPIVKDDEKAFSELTKLKAANERKLDGMARDIKKMFKVDRLDPATIKKVQAELKNTIEKTKAEDLKKLLKNRDPKIVPKCCWLVGCD
jgi:hypothetical protein